MRRSRSASAKRFSRTSAKLLGKRSRTVMGRSRRGTTGVIGRSPATRGSRTFGVEVKTMDMPMIAAGADTVTRTVSTTATIDLLNGIQTGAAFFNRVGSRVHNKSLHITGDIFPTGNGTNISEFNRIMLVYDRQPNGAFPAGGINDILADVGNDGTAVTSSYSKANMNNVERFAIIRDSRVVVGQNGSNVTTASGYGQSLPGDVGLNKISWFVPLKDLETHYKSSSNPAAIGDVATGALYLVTYGSQAAASAGTQFQYNSRLRFIDL